MSNKNLTGGDFSGGIPKDCFQTSEQMVAGDRAVLEKTTVTQPGSLPDFDQEADDPRLASNQGLQPEQAVFARGQWVD